MKIVTITNILIVLCVAIFFAEATLFTNILVFALYYWESPLFTPIQLFSHLFLHGGLAHLGLNMLGLWLFGNAVERVWGWGKFLCFYMVCGLGAAVIYQTVNYYQFQQAIEPLLAAGLSLDTVAEAFSNSQYFPSLPTSADAFVIFSSPVVGASGALYGILVAYACLFPNQKMILIFLPFPIAAKFFMPLLLVIELLSGITGFSLFGQNIAHAAHIGGAITALIILCPLLMKRSRRSQLP